MDKYTVRGTDGSVDVSASAAKYAAALEVWAQANEIPADQISSAVNAVLDSFPGTRLPMPALLSKSVERLGATPGQFSSLTKRVQAFVTGQKSAGILSVTKGKGGGVARAAQ